MWVHYTEFGVNAVSMVMPWVILAIVGARRAVGRELGAGKRRRVLWVLLGVSFPALLVLFWAWPGANARYMMMVAYPVSVLAAWVVEGGGEKWAKWWPAMRGAAVVMGVFLFAGTAYAMWAARKLGSWPRDLTFLAVVGIAIALVLIWLAKRSPPEEMPMAAVASLAIVGMVGWGLGKSVFNPIKATTDATRRLHEQIAAVVPKDRPIYTTRTLSSGRGNNYFNAQFYLPGGAKALTNFVELPVDRRVTVILAPEEWEALQAVAPGARELGRLEAANGPRPLVVAEVTR